LTTPEQKHRTVVAWIAFAGGVLLPIGWTIASIANWSDVVDSHARLGYLIGDIGIVMPLCFATWQGLRTRAPWGPAVLCLLCGAFAYDILHFTVWLIQEHKFGIPGIVLALIGAAIIAFLAWLAIWELQRMRPTTTEAV
jgi:hypothetical protein